MAHAKLLIADDDAKILGFLSEFFTREGFEVHSALDGLEALAKFKLVNPDLVILDIMMPKMDGLETCLKMRRESKVPILMLTAKGETEDKIRGLTYGCDDYISKPFDNRELLLRIKAILRRSDLQNNGPDKNVLNFGSLIIEKESRNVYVFGKNILLTRKEFDLLWLLASRPDKVFTRDQLIKLIWDTEYCEDTAIVTTLVKRLRKKLELNLDNPEFIVTIRGIGYKFGDSYKNNTENVM